MIVELKTGSSVAKIDSKGAELISLLDVFGTEYIWQKNPEFWAKSSPVLFPAIGNLIDGKTKIGGKEYSIPKHGFCNTAEFKILFQSENKVVFSYTANDETLKMFPFNFHFTMTYSLFDDHLQIDYAVFNMGDVDMPYCIGAHPAFNVPVGEGEFEDYSLVFNKNEDCTAIVYDIDRLRFDVEKRVDYLKKGNQLDLKYSYFDNDAIVFEKINSDSVTLKSRKTGRGVQVDYKGFKSIAFWTPVKKNAPFLCIEPWNGMAARSDDDGNFEHKFGVETLKPDQTANYSLAVYPL